MIRASYRCPTIRLALIAACLGATVSRAAYAQEPAPRAAGHTAQSAAAEIGGETWKTYRDEKAGYSIRYPGEASVSTDDGECAVRFGLSEVFVGADEGENSVDLELCVSVHSNDRRMSAKSWARSYLLEDDPMVQKQGDLRIGGLSAYRVVLFGGDQGEFHVVITKGARLYEITHMGSDNAALPEEVRRRCEHRFDAMVESFEIIGGSTRR